MGWVVSVTPRPHFTPGKDPVPIVQGAGWAPGPVCTGAENLVPTGIRSRTVQPVVSRYTDRATRPIYIYIYIAKGNICVCIYIYVHIHIFPLTTVDIESVTSRGVSEFLYQTSAWLNTLSLNVRNWNIQIMPFSVTMAAMLVSQIPQLTNSTEQNASWEPELLAKKFPVLYVTRRFITVFNDPTTWPYSEPEQSNPCPHPNSWRPIFVLSIHLGLGLPNGFFPWGIPNKTLYALRISHIRATWPALKFPVPLNYASGSWLTRGGHIKWPPNSPDSGPNFMCGVGDFQEKICFWLMLNILIYWLPWSKDTIPDGVNLIFHWHNPSGRTMALRFIQPLTEMSNRTISWRAKAAGT